MLKNISENVLIQIVNQTYKNLQIILVDDGSTDNSGKICDEFAKKDSRITVVHQENQGAGAAKNTGLELIEGEYFSIIDSDDYIDLSMYEKMVSLMKQYNSDIVQCLFKQVYVNKIIMRQYSTLKKIVHSVNPAKNICNTFYLIGSLLFLQRKFLKTSFAWWCQIFQ